jgi:hypothetical protein
MCDIHPDRFYYHLFFDRFGRMENLLAARTQMALSLMFHIIFAVVGVALPLLMSLLSARFPVPFFPLSSDFCGRSSWNGPAPS